MLSQAVRIGIRCVLLAIVSVAYIGVSENAYADGTFPRHLIGFNTRDGRTETYAKELAEIFVSKAAGFSENPTCCLWVEHWSPTDVESKYLFLLQKHGGVLYVTDSDAMEDAKQWLLSLPKSEEGMPIVPLGVTTNFRVIERGKELRQ